MTHVKRAKHWLWRTRTTYLGLLVSMLVMICLIPLVGSGRILDISFGVVFFLILVSAVQAISGRRWYRRAAWGLLILSSTGYVLLLVAPGTLFALLRLVPSVIFFTMVIVTILSHIFEARDKSTVDRILGAICAYLLLGIGWSVIYSTLELLNPGSFRFPEDLAIGMTAGSENPLNIFIYYSFVTLSTLGFGDIAPVSEVARTFSVLEAIAGQIYLAVIIAGLVGVHISKRSDYKTT